VSIEIVGKNCVGCRGCGQICPQDCITFKANDEGFICPHVDTELCVDCGVCEKVCPVLNPYKNREPTKTYAAWNTNLNELRASSSGGVFSALAHEILNKNGVICGCTNDEVGMPYHAFAFSEKELHTMCGSKYVESDIRNVYTETEQYLRKGISVFFVGTPCQVAGLKNFVGVEYDNLFTADIICHGVPSRELYKSYLDWLGTKHRGKVKSYFFRSKDKHGWSLTYCYYILKPNGKEKRYEAIASLTPYYYGFLSGAFYRESCYQCKYCTSSRSGDVTLGDFWGVENTSPKNFNINGVSAVLVNNAKGQNMINTADERLYLDEVNFEEISINNSNLKRPTIRPQVRDKIYKEWRSEGFGKIASKYLISPDYKIDYIKNFLPNSVRQKIKACLKSIRFRLDF
jgi:coenzyme F420-reducing hydrogenase beta subunit